MLVSPHPPPPLAFTPTPQSTQLPLSHTLSWCAALANTEIEVQGCVNWKLADKRIKTEANRLERVSAPSVINLCVEKVERVVL